MYLYFNVRASIERVAAQQGWPLMVPGVPMLLKKKKRIYTIMYITE